MIGELHVVTGWLDRIGPGRIDAEDTEKGDPDRWQRPGDSTRDQRPEVSRVRRVGFLRQPGHFYPRVHLFEGRVRLAPRQSRGLSGRCL